MELVVKLGLVYYNDFMLIYLFFYNCVFNLVIIGGIWVWSFDYELWENRVNRNLILIEI